MIVQFGIAGQLHGAVVGTDHASEAVTGFIPSLAMVLRILLQFGD